MVNHTVVNHTVNNAAATVAPGVYGLLGSLLLSGFVVAAPMLSEQEASREPVLETAGVNHNTGQQAKAKAKANEPDAEQVASTMQKRSLITLESTIVGDKEQPTVLTLVPWQKPEHESVMSKPVSRQIGMKFTALEVDSLKRELHYYQKSKQ